MDEIKLNIFKSKLKENEYGHKYKKIDELYEDLTPRSDVDEDGDYEELISWALNNDDIKNIALTGPYGSGKSSIIKTHVKNNEGKNEYLNISLATFNTAVRQDENELEKSILQQMIYKVKNNKIPFTRFKRIKSQKKSRASFYLILFLVFIFSGLQIFMPELLVDIYDRTFIKKNIDSGDISMQVMMVLLVIIFTGSLVLFLTNVFYFISKNFNLYKISFPNLTIELDKQSEGSIFHKYLDEILYFFEVTKYNVVIFEDLDRFNNLDIFENLRELNSLINNSEQIGKRVVFMYALRDDLFGEKDDILISRNRTKFFDFIIPIIPTINSSNSGEILLGKFKKSPLGKDISETFINDITIYIDDMRILKNICNEYNIYKTKLRKINLIPNSLLAIIVYKNIYPVDFSDLQFNKGMIHQVFQRKNDIMEKTINQISTKISNIEKDIESVENERLNSLDELKIVYAQALGLHNNNTNYTYLINIDNTRYNHSNWTSVDFGKLKTAKNISYRLGSKNGNSKEDIETVFGTKENYSERVRIVELKEHQKTIYLKKEIEKLNREKEEVTSWSLKEFISNNKEFFDDNIKDKKLIVFLLRNGYIDEMYHQYITYFYPGKLTKEDMKFIMSIKDHERLPFNFRLTNTSEIIKRLYGHEIRRTDVLNYDLLDFIIEKGYNLYQEMIISQIVDESERSIRFIDGYMILGKHKEIFIKALCKKWTNIWSYLVHESNYTNDKIDIYLLSIIKFADIEDIVAINQNELLSELISDRDDFLELVSEVEYYPKVKDVLIKLQVEFKSINKSNKVIELFDFIYENSLYYINKEMLKIIMNDQYEDECSLNYSSILQSNRQHLIEYINNNIDKYIENVFIRIENNTEPEEGIISLLNKGEELSFENKVAIIEVQQELINDLAEVPSELWSKIIGNNKVKVSWSNIISYYNKVNSIDKSLILFLNDKENSIKLSKDKLFEINNVESDILDEFTVKIIEGNQITDNYFEILTKSMQKWNDYDTSKLKQSRAEIMVKNNILTLTTENYNSLKQNFKNLHIFLLEINIDLFINHRIEYELESEDVYQLMNSLLINDNIKSNIIQHMGVEVITGHNKLAALVTNHLLNNRLIFTENLLNTLLDSDIDEDKKITLLTGKIKDLESESITKLLSKLKEPYSEIAKNGRRPSLTVNKLNRDLITELENKNYISSWNDEEKKIRINTFRG